MKFGMSVRKVFDCYWTPVPEAVAISVEQKKEKKLMNSKGEYNRYTVQWLTTQTKKAFKEKLEDNAEERVDQEKIKELRKEKLIWKFEKLQRGRKRVNA